MSESTTDDALKSVLTDPGEWTFAYVDGHGGEPTVTEEKRQKSVRERLTDAGAPEPDAEAIERALADAAGMPSPSARYLLARQGEIVLDEKIAGPRIGPECVGHGDLPAVVPLLRHGGRDTPILVVETAREGANIRSERVGRAGTGRDTEVDGRPEDLTKVRTGGLAHARFHRRSEEIWKQNQTEVAETVDRLVREQRPRFVFVSGDVRARGLLTDALSPASRDLVVEVDAHTKAEGSDEGAVDDAIDTALDEALSADEDAARDRAASSDGALRAEGVEEVVAALQQAQVDTLLLDAAIIDSDTPLSALSAAPWVAGAEEDTPGADRIATIPMAEALARAALLTDARVLVTGDEPADGEPRTDESAEPPVALLRWSDEVS